jgi:5-methyltetrahydrofolate--homocysteine methyltransferase
MDGAMGTELMRRGWGSDIEDSHDWNLSHRDVVHEVHASYLHAGAVCLLTNSFLADNDRSGNAFHIAVEVARQCGRGDHFILLDMAVAESAMRLLKSPPKVDAILLETQCALGPVARWMHEDTWSGEIPWIVSFSYFRPEGKLVTGADRSSPESVAEFVNTYSERIVALGVNCGLHLTMEDNIEIVRRYRRVTDLPILARPNAGMPEKIGDQRVYPYNPTAMAALLPELIEAGATLIGGCCGTTPAHIAAFREVIDKMGVGWSPE